MMEGTKIDYDGTEVKATDFLDGVIVDYAPKAANQPVFVPGYYVQEMRGDMDGPALWPRKFGEENE